MGSQRVRHNWVTHTHLPCVNTTRSIRADRGREDTPWKSAKARTSCPESPSTARHPPGPGEVGPRLWSSAAGRGCQRASWQSQELWARIPIRAGRTGVALLNSHDAKWDRKIYWALWGRCKQADLFSEILFVAGGSPHLGQEESGSHHSLWAPLTSTPLSITGFPQSSQLHLPAEARYSWTSHSRPCGTHRCLHSGTAIAAASASFPSPSSVPPASASILAALSTQMRRAGIILGDWGGEGIFFSSSSQDWCCKGLWQPTAHFCLDLPAFSCLPETLPH